MCNIDKKRGVGRWFFNKIYVEEGRMEKNKKTCDAYVGNV